MKTAKKKINGALRAPVRPAEILFPASEWLGDAATELEGGVETYSTGIGALDEALGGGLVPGMGVVIGGASENGKSLLVQGVAWSLLGNGRPVLLIDIENGRSRLLRRFLAMAGFLSKEAIRKLAGSERRNYQRALSEVSSRFRLLSAPRPAEVRTPDQIAEVVAQLRDRFPDDPVTVIVDSLHKLPSGAPDKRSAVDNWSHFFERLRADYEVTVIKTAEVNRDSESTSDPFKESGGIKYSNDVAIVLSGLAGGRIGCLRIVKHRDESETPRRFEARVSYPNVIMTPLEKRGTTDRLDQARRRISAFVRSAMRPVTRDEIHRSVRMRDGTVAAALRSLIAEGELTDQRGGKIALANGSPAATRRAAGPAGPSRGPAGSRGHKGSEE